MLAILLFAMLCAFAGGLNRNHVAWPLVASAVLCIGLDYLGVPFNPLLWTVVDVAVIVAIIRIRGGWRKLGRVDWAILGLFVPGWVAYALPADPRAAITFAVVVAQMVLTLPFATMRDRLKGAHQQPEKWNEFDLMVTA
jgi:hypothetical protein